MKSWLLCPWILPALAMPCFASCLPPDSAFCEPIALQLSMNHGEHAIEVQDAMDCIASIALLLHSEAIALGNVAGRRPVAYILCWWCCSGHERSANTSCLKHLIQYMIGDRGCLRDMPGPFKGLQDLTCNPQCIPLSHLQRQGPPKPSFWSHSKGHFAVCKQAFPRARLYFP